MKRLLRVTVWVLCPFLCYFGLAVLGAFVPQFDRADVDASPVTHEIILVAGLIHYDILLPVDDTTLERFAFVEDAGVIAPVP